MLREKIQAFEDAPFSDEVDFIEEVMQELVGLHYDPYDDAIIRIDKRDSNSSASWSLENVTERVQNRSATFTPRLKRDYPADALVVRFWVSQGSFDTTYYFVIGDPPSGIGVPYNRELFLSDLARVAWIFSRSWK